MPNRTCILITSLYPFDTCGSFLDDEIFYLSNAFQKIHIYVIDKPSNIETKHIVPDNVEVICLNLTSNKFQSLKYILAGLIYKDKSLKINTRGILAVLFSLYMRGKAQVIANKIMQHIVGNKTINTTELLVYSYWFGVHAIAAGKLKEEFLRKKIYVRAISRGHGYDIYSERSRIGILPFQDVSLKRLDKIYAISENGKNYLAEKYPNYKDKIAISRLGTPDYGVCLKNSGTNEQIIITCSNIISLKRVDLFAKAFVLVVQQNPNCKWVCIGDGPELNKVKAIIENSCARKKVAFLGRIKREEVLHYYQNHFISLFCNVSEYEGIPVSIMEALSFGIPVVATNVGGTGEIVDNKVGSLVKKDITCQALAEVIINILSKSNTENKELRKNSRDRWKKIASAENNYKQWVKEIMSICCKKEEF